MFTRLGAEFGRLAARAGLSYSQLNVILHSMSTNEDAVSTLAELERKAIQRAMAICGGQQTKAARHLGVTPRVLNWKLMNLGLRPKDSYTPPSYEVG